PHRLLAHGAVHLDAHHQVDAALQIEAQVQVLGGRPFRPRLFEDARLVALRGRQAEVGDAGHQRPDRQDGDGQDQSGLPVPRAIHPLSYPFFAASSAGFSSVAVLYGPWICALSTRSLTLLATSTNTRSPATRSTFPTTPPEVTPSSPFPSFSRQVLWSFCWRACRRMTMKSKFTRNSAAGSSKPYSPKADCC